MPDLPPLNGLRAFAVAGRRLSFRAAADELGVTQGAVAQQVRQLEAHLGLPLFDRLPKGLALTAAGRGYHGAIAAAFDQMRQATSALKPEPNKVLISVTPSFAAKWLIPNLPTLAAEHPEVDLRILATEAISSFHSDGIDIAIRQGRPPMGAALDVKPLFRNDIIAVAAPALLQTVGDTPGCAALVQLPRLHDSHAFWPAFLAQLGLKDDSDARGLQLNQTALALDAAVSGQGVALVSRVLARRDLEEGRLVQVVPDALATDQNFYLVTQRLPRGAQAVKDVISWFMSMAQAENGSG